MRTLQYILPILLYFALFLPKSSSAQWVADTVITGELTEEKLQALIARENRLMEQSKSPFYGSVKIISNPAEIEELKKSIPARISGTFVENLAEGNPQALKAALIGLMPAFNSEEDILATLRELGNHKLGFGWGANEEIRQRVRQFAGQEVYRAYALKAWARIDPQEAWDYMISEIETGNMPYFNLIDLTGNISIPVALSRKFLEMHLEKMEAALVRKAPSEIPPTRWFVPFNDKITFAAENDRKFIWEKVYGMEPAIKDPDIKNNWADFLITNAPASKRDLLPDLLSFLEHDFFRQYRKLDIIKLEPVSAKRKQAFLSYLEEDDNISSIPDEIQAEFKGDEYPLFDKMVDLYESGKIESPGTLISEVWKMKGLPGLQYCLNKIKNPEKKAGFEKIFQEGYAPMLPDHPMAKMIADIEKFRVLCQPVDPEVREEYRRDAADYGDSQYRWAVEACIPQFVQFDAETGMFPNPYDELFLEYFVPAACGKLDGLDVRMTYEEDYRNPNTQVYLFFRDKAYHISPNDGSDWYDVGAVETVINKILETEGFEERFNGWDTGDQTAGYFFGEPARSRAMLKRLEAW